MRRMMVFFAALITAVPGLAQKPPKIDSLLIRLPIPKAAAMDRVVEAFMLAGLSVTDQTSSMVESDQGSNTSALSSVRFTRVVRALLVGRDSVTSVFITGEEVRADAGSNRDFKRLRIDNRAGGQGGKVWLKMVAAARALDSTQAP